MEQPRPGPAAVAVSAVLGLVVGAVGTLMHRSVQPWGVVVCLLLVVSAGVVARAWDGWRTFLGYGVAVVVASQVLAQQGPGGDVLVPAHQAIGWVWVLGAPVALVLVALLPRRLFADRPRAAVVAPDAPGWPPASPELSPGRTSVDGTETP